MSLYESEALQQQEHDIITELSHTISELAEENQRLEARLAINSSGGTDEEKASIEQILSDLQEQVKKLEAENRVLIASRNAFQNDAVEMKKQAIYGKRRYEKAEKEVTMWYQKSVEYGRQIAYMEADLAMR